MLGNPTALDKSTGTVRDQNFDSVSYLELVLGNKDTDLESKTAEKKARAEFEQRLLSTAMNGVRKLIKE